MPPLDPLASGVAVVTLALTSLAASVVAMRRALRITPVDALRQE